MKQSVAIVLVAVSLLTAASESIADVLAKYEYTYSGDFGLVNYPSQSAANISGTEYSFESDSSSEATGWSGVEGNPGAAFYCQAMSDSTDSYTYFSIVISNGYEMTLDSLVFDSKRGADAPTSTTVYYSTNGSSFFSIGSGSISGASYQQLTADNGGTAISNLQGTVYFRIKCDTWFGKSGPPPVDSDQIWYHDNVTVNGTIEEQGGGNEAPTDLALSSATVAENEPVGTTVGVLDTTDPDTGDTFTYTLVAGSGAADNGSFSISDSNLLTAASFNYESKSNYTVRIRTTDQGSLWYEEVLPLTITDVWEPPPEFGDLAMDGTDAILTWSSCANHTYTLHDSTSLSNGFFERATGILATPPMNTYTDTLDGASVKFWQVTTEQ